MWVDYAVTAISATLESPENLPQLAIAPDNPPVDHAVKLGWILLNKKLISLTELESALIHQYQCHQKLGELLMEENLISDEQLEQALREQYWRRNGYWII